MAGSGGAGLTTGNAVKGPSPAGPPKPQGVTSKPIQVKAHTRAAPAPKPSKPAKPTVAPAPAPNPLLAQAQALAKIQTQDPITELQRQIAANNAQTNGTINLAGGFYNQLEPFVQQGVTQSGQIASGLNSTLAGINQGTQSQLQGIGQGAMSSLLKYAPGDNANAATADLAAQIARQQGLAAQQGQTYQGFGANQGANYQQAANSNLGTFGLQGQEALRGIAQSGTVKNQPLVSKIAGLQAQQGALTATDLGKLQQQQTANRIAEAGLGIKQATLANTAANDRANQQLKARGQNITAANDQSRNGIAQQRANTAAQQQAFNNNPSKVGSAAWERVQHETGTQFANDPNAVGSAAWARVQAANARSAKARAGGGTKPLTTNENNVANTRIGTIISAIQTWQKTGIKNSKGKVLEPHPTDAQMRQVLGSSYASPLIEAAFDLLGYGVLTPQTARALHNMGIRNTTFRGRPVRVANPRSTGGAISGAGGGGGLF